MDYRKKALLLHKKLRGKIKISSKVKVSSKDILSTIYTPGVGEVSTQIGRDKKLSWEYTGRANTIAIVSDGTAVLGLGNIGPEAALPVMEGKAVLFSELANVNAIPLCINATSKDEIVNLVRAIEPSIGGVNLEDIAAPMCFEVEQELVSLDIPVFHDDQDGTAVVVLAGLLNAAGVIRRDLGELRVVIFGAGAAGLATAWLLSGYEKWSKRRVNYPEFRRPRDIIIVDSKGIVHEKRDDLNKWKRKTAQVTNSEGRTGGLEAALKDADVLIGLSTGGKILPKHIKIMNKNPIVFALSNPIPEIMPDEARKAGAVVVATGRSDFPNQINNALVFPGMFRGLLDAKIRTTTAKTKIAASFALSSTVKPSRDRILPSVLDRRAHRAIAQAVKSAAKVVK